MVDFHALENPAGQLLRLLGGVSHVGNPSAPSLAVDFPRVHLGDPACDRPREGGLPRHRDRLCRGKAKQAVQKAADTVEKAVTKVIG